MYRIASRSVAGKWGFRPRASMKAAQQRTPAMYDGSDRLIAASMFRWPASSSNAPRPLPEAASTAIACRGCRRSVTRRLKPAASMRSVNVCRPSVCAIDCSLLYSCMACATTQPLRSSTDISVNRDNHQSAPAFGGGGPATNSAKLCACSAGGGT
eukprot:3254576-Pyramimonas_sp.AAC.1